MTSRVDWAQNLRAARLERKLTQEKLARGLDIGMIQISRWERGVTIPRDAMKLRIAKFYGVAVSDLFPWEPTGTDEEAVAS